MKITERMLKDWIKVPANIYEITNQKIIEVESFQKVNEATDLVIGHVLTCEDHPNSDHLHVTTVDLGNRVEQIVCGAPNVKAGQFVIVAQVGTVLPGDFQIKASKIRGVESNGMICSLKELGIDDKVLPKELQEGIYHFNKEMPIGSEALPHLAQDGFVLELGLTPNRSDLLSVLGFAYDLASMTNQKITLPTYKIKEEETKNPFKIKIETKGCGRYYARHLTDVKIKQSPWWLRSALLANDIKPINNVVDISNYVLIEYGTPLHMFDAKKIKSTEILVRNAIENEEVVTLDEETRVLEHQDVVITNGKEVIAVGGVMGLENSMIDDHTTEVLIEAAYFDPKHIQKTSKRLGLRSDSSLRFERGIDDQRVLLGLERATSLMIELADAKVSCGIAEAINYEVNNPEIEIPKNYFNEKLGLSLSEEEILNYLNAYNYQVKVSDSSYIVTAPSYRKDILIKADVLEEIARMHGLDHIPMQTAITPTMGKLSSKQQKLRNLRHQLAHLGLHEVISYSLLPTPEVHKYQNIGEPISLLMPLSEDKKTLRQSLINGLLQTVSYNQNRQLKDVSIFEIGHVFAKGKEELHLGIALSGIWHESKWQKFALKPDFFVLKGILESALKPLDIELTFKQTSEYQRLHPYRQAEIYYKDHLVGLIAEVHPKERKDLDIELTYVLDIHLDPILKEEKALSYQLLSKYPNIERDLAIVVDESVEASTLLNLIKQTVRKQLVSIDIFDVYQGSHIEAGKKSVAFNLVFNDSEKTLESEDVEALMKKITKRLIFEFKATIRS